QCWCRASPASFPKALSSFSQHGGSTVQPGPAIFDVQVLSVNPAELGERSPKSGDTSLPFWIGFGETHHIRSVVCKPARGLEPRADDHPPIQLRVYAVGPRERPQVFFDQGRSAIPIIPAVPRLLALQRCCL